LSAFAVAKARCLIISIELMYCMAYKRSNEPNFTLALGYASVDFFKWIARIKQEIQSPFEHEILFSLTLITIKLLAYFSMQMIRQTIIVCALLSLTGCDKLMEVVNKQQANGKAIGAACRHSGRALEDCYRRNGRVPKADIFAGWKDMNEYMQQKKIEVIQAPEDEAPVAVRKTERRSTSEESPAGADKAEH
jgi:hypothetical protein